MLATMHIARDAQPRIKQTSNKQRGDVDFVSNKQTNVIQRSGQPRRLVTPQGWPNPSQWWIQWLRLIHSPTSVLRA